LNGTTNELFKDSTVKFPRKTVGYTAAENKKIESKSLERWAGHLVKVKIAVLMLSEHCSIAYKVYKAHNI